MKRRPTLILIFAIALFCTVETLPFWGMPPAIFLDSERSKVSRVPSPDGSRIAQVERIVVGGVPSIVVMVRPWWMPDWYLAGCPAAFHYEDTAAQIAWAANDAIAVTRTDGQRFWNTGGLHHFIVFHATA